VKLQYICIYLSLSGRNQFIWFVRVCSRSLKIFTLKTR